MGTDVLLPSWFKHFGEGAGGLGDTRHIGIFGKTGSGKSYLAKMILMSYMRHNTMTIVVLDPQGEFTRMQGDNTAMDYINNTLNRQIQFLNLGNITYPSGTDRPSRAVAVRKFLLLLRSARFLVDELNIRAPENQDQAVSVLLDVIMGLNIHSNQLFVRANFIAILERLDRANAQGERPNLARIYRGEAGQDGIHDRIANGDRNAMFERWQAIANLFGHAGAQQIDVVLAQIREPGTPGRIMVLDLKEYFINHLII